LRHAARQPSACLFSGFLKSFPIRHRSGAAEQMPLAESLHLLLPGHVLLMVNDAPGAGMFRVKSLILFVRIACQYFFSNE
jgi:hypothetical protein